MKCFSNVGKTALVAFCCFCCTLSAAQANASLTTKAELKTKGVNAKYMEIVGLSPDNKYLCVQGRAVRDAQNDDIRNLVFVFNVNSDNSLGKLKTFTVNEVPRIEQIAFAPDSKSIIIVGQKGAKIVKLDISSGRVTTIMEHVKGQSGFKCFPPVLTYNHGEMLIQGYYYNEHTVCGPNTISILDTNKTGLDAFTQANDLDKMQLETRRGYKNFIETYPRKDIGFMALTKGTGGWDCYRWSDKKGTQEFDKAQAILGFWGGDNRVIYSAQRTPQSFDLIIYDGEKDEKITLSEGRKDPYTYVFLSADGKTALFNEEDDQNKTTKIMYARESEGWEVKPLKDLDRRIRKGSLRISKDGTKAAQHSSQGIRIIDIE